MPVKAFYSDNIALNQYLIDRGEKMTGQMLAKTLPGKCESSLCCARPGWKVWDGSANRDGGGRI